MVWTKSCWATALMCSTQMVSAAYAQDTDSTASVESVNANSEQLEVIVVTAQRRDESVQRVPASITAFSSETLENLGVTEADDISAYVSNVSWRPGFGYTNPHIFLRGLGSDSYAAHGTPVGIYVDGIYLGANAAQGFQTFDLERIEVLKGPQGTLYGRNTTGGIINYISRRPSLADSANGNLTLTLGSHERLEMEAAGGAALSDHIAVRGAVTYRRRDGEFDNGNPALPAGDIGDFESFAGRFQILAAPSDNVEILLRGYGGQTRAELAAGRQIGLLDPNTPGAPCPNPNPAFGECADLFGFRGQTDNYHTLFYGLDPREDADAYGVSATLTFDFEDFQVISLTAYDRVKTWLLEDTDQSPTEILTGSYDRDVEMFNQELRAVSDSNARFRWIAGLNYYHDVYDAWNAASATGLGPGGLAPFPGAGLQGVASDLIQTTETFAIFGELAYDLTDRLTVTGGLRWTSDNREVEHEAFLFNAAGLSNSFISRQAGLNARLFNTIPQNTLEKTWKRITGRVVIDYDVTDDILAYGSFSRGFRGGEFNLGALFYQSEQTLSGPEYNNAWEIGLKSTLANGQLRLNAAAFYYDLQNLQVFVLSSSPGINFPTQTLSDTGQARVLGAEADIEWQASDRLYVRSSVGFLDTEFTDFPFSDTINYRGNRLSAAPKFTFSGMARYTVPLGSGQFYVQPEASYNSSQFFNVENRPYMLQSGYWIVNARIGWESDDNRYGITAWATNLTDTEYTSHRFDLSTFGFAGSTLGQGRSFGLTLNYRFD